MQRGGRFRVGLGLVRLGGVGLQLHSVAATPRGGRDRRGERLRSTATIECGRTDSQASGLRRARHGEQGTNGPLWQPNGASLRALGCGSAHQKCSLATTARHVRGQPGHMANQGRMVPKWAPQTGWAHRRHYLHRLRQQRDDVTTSGSPSVRRAPSSPEGGHRSAHGWNGGRDAPARNPSPWSGAAADGTRGATGGGSV